MNFWGSDNMPSTREYVEKRVAAGQVVSAREVRLDPAEFARVFPEFTPSKDAAQRCGNKFNPMDPKMADFYCTRQPSHDGSCACGVEDGLYFVWNHIRRLN